MKAKTTSLKGREWIPVNKVAATVSGIYDNYERPGTKSDDKGFKIPPKTIPFLGPYEFNLIGSRKGRLTIRGYIGSIHQTSCWLAKCDCGFYLRRNGNRWRTSLKNLENSITLYACHECRRLEHLRKVRKFKPVRTLSPEKIKATLEGARRELIKGPSKWAKRFIERYGS